MRCMASSANEKLPPSARREMCIRDRYCGGALEKGTLHSRGGEYFLPDGAKLPAGFTRESMEKVGAVSYTHLDVYKRQQSKRN